MLDLPLYIRIRLLILGHTICIVIFIIHLSPLLIIETSVSPYEMSPSTEIRCDDSGHHPEVYQFLPSLRTIYLTVRVSQIRTSVFQAPPVFTKLQRFRPWPIQLHPLDTLYSYLSVYPRSVLYRMDSKSQPYIWSQIFTLLWSFPYIIPLY